MVLLPLLGVPRSLEQVQLAQPSFERALEFARRVSRERQSLWLGRSPALLWLGLGRPIATF